MKKFLLPFFVAAFAHSCDPLSTGDDIGGPICLPHQLKIEQCEATQYTKKIRFRVLQNFQGCASDAPVPLRFDIHAPNNGVVAYQITGPGGEIRNSPNDQHKIANLANQLLAGTVTLANSSVMPELDGGTTDQFGNEIVFDDQSIDCPWIPPCEDQLTDHCSYINPNNHCAAATTYKFDLCETTQLTMKFSTNGFGLAKYSNGSYAPITRTIHHPNGTTTSTSINPLQTFTGTFHPGAKLSVSYGSNIPLPVPNIVGSSQLNIISGNTQLPSPIITLLNDPC